jgi:hypothetical protein
MPENPYRPPKEVEPKPAPYFGCVVIVAGLLVMVAACFKLIPQVEGLAMGAAIITLPGIVRLTRRLTGL